MAEDDYRLDYTAAQEELLQRRAEALERLREEATRTRQPQELEHRQEFLVAANKLKVAGMALEQIKQANDQDWATAKQNYQVARAELDQAFQLARRHLT